MTLFLLILNGRYQLQGMHLHGPHLQTTASHALIKHFTSKHYLLTIYINPLHFNSMLSQSFVLSSMATPKIHFFSSFLLCTTFLCFLHCTLCLLDPEDEVGILVQADDDDQSNRDSRKICDFSLGKWVYDDSYPLYDSNCPYISSVVTCQKNGRPDSDYEKWKWKPSGCTLPRYIGLFMLLV